MRLLLFSAILLISHSSFGHTAADSLYAKTDQRAYVDAEVASIYESSYTSAGTVTVADSLALVSFYDATDGDNWSQNLNWKVGSVNQWQFIEVENGRVTGLVMHNNSLNRASIPDDQVWPDSLIRLHIFQSGASGPVPSSIQSLEHLRELNLAGNWFSGQIPAWIGEKIELSLLGLGRNEFTGPIPPSLGNLDKLDGLDLRYNQFSGPIPATFGNLKVRVLRMDNAGSLGPLPSELGDMVELEELYLYQSGLTGSIPASLGNLTNLTHLSLAGNSLEGQIPAELSSLALLQLLDLSRNNLSGAIPESIGSMQNLERLSLFRNALEGPIPDPIWTLSTLKGLFLSDNPITGSIPEAIGGLTNLEALELRGTHLEGAIPEAISGLLALEVLDLRRTNLEGVIPSQIGQLKGLRGLYISGGNGFQGGVPEFLLELPLLEDLDLSELGLTGGVPTWIGDLRNLKYVNLSGNPLGGGLPRQLGNLTNLEFLGLAGMELEGMLPQELSRLNLLGRLDVSNNSLRGPIPPEFVQMISLVNWNSSSTNICEPLEPSTQNWILGIDYIGSGVDCSLLDASFSLSVVSGDAPLMIDAVATGINPSGSSYDWSIRGTHIGSGKEATLYIRYGGVHDLELTVTDGNLSRTASEQIYVGSTQPVAEYDFNGDAQNRAADWFHGQVFNAQLTSDRFGQASQAYLFEGESSIEIPGSEDQNYLPLSISMWAKPDSGNVSNSTQSLFSKYYPAAWNGYQMSLYTDSLEARGGFWLAPWYLKPGGTLIGAYGHPEFWAEKVVPETWSHFVFVVDENGGYIYKDGVLASSQEWSGTPGRPTSKFAWRIGGRYQVTCCDELGAGLYFQGVLDDVKVYADALTAEEVAALYQEEARSPFMTISILVQDAQYERELILGEDPDGSDGYDDGLDAIAPPPPPSGVFDARLKGSSQDFFTDIRGLVSNEATWTLQTQPASGDIRITWDPGSFPATGAFRINDAVTGELINVDMRVESELVMTTSLPLIITYSVDEIVPVAIASGWNMVGLPVQRTSAVVSGVFSSSLANTLFSFDGIYQRPENDEMAPGEGYWLRFPADQAIDVVGKRITSIALPLKSGWNMVSGPTCTLPVSSVLDGDLTLDGTLFGFAGTYLLADTMQPGKGYWIRASRSGTLALDCAAVGKKPADRSDETAGWESLVWRDESGREQRLFLAQSVVKKAGSYSLPPSSPSQVWRVQYEDGSYVSEGSTSIIQILGEPGSLSLTASSEMRLELLSASGTPLGTMVAGVSELIIGEDVRFVRLVTDVQPVAFQLHGAYPNPFNPTTNIAFDLPESADVRLMVYDLLGRRVMQLAQEGMPAGASRTMQVDGSRLASGQYFYRVEARMASGVEAATGKFVLLK